MCFIVAVKELENYLSAEFMDKVALNDDAKADIVIAGQWCIYIRVINQWKSFIGLLNDKLILID